MLGAVCAVAAAVGTAAWALVLVEVTMDTVRYGVMFAGLLALLSCIVKPPCNGPDGVSVGLGMLLAGYQSAVYIAMRTQGAQMQALVNCNVILIAVYRQLNQSPAKDAAGFAAAAIAAAATAALLAAHRF